MSLLTVVIGIGVALLFGIGNELSRIRTVLEKMAGEERKS